MNQDKIQNTFRDLTMSVVTQIGTVVAIYAVLLLAYWMFVA